MAASPITVEPWCPFERACCAVPALPHSDKRAVHDATILFKALSDRDGCKFWMFFLDMLAIRVVVIVKASSVYLTKKTAGNPSNPRFRIN